MLRKIFRLLVDGYNYQKRVDIYDMKVNEEREMLKSRIIRLEDFVLEESRFTNAEIENERNHIRLKRAREKAEFERTLKSLSSFKG